jgi:hypothetical protein
LETPHHGKINFSNGDIYNGNISTDLHPAGDGKMQFANGSSYDGNWRNGLMHGTGFFKWSTGASYEGSILNYSG